MGIPSIGDIDGEGNLAVPGQEVPAKCPTCGRKIGEDSHKEKPKHRVSKTIKVPKQEQEDGVRLLEDSIKHLEEMMFPGRHRPPYYTIMDAINYTILNANATDFE